MGKYIKTEFEKDNGTSRYDNVCCALIGLFGMPAMFLACLSGKRVTIDVRDTKEMTFAKECMKSGMSGKETLKAVKDWREDYPDGV